MEQGILLKPAVDTDNVGEEDSEEEEEEAEVLFDDDDMEYGSDENGGLTEMMTAALTKLGINEQHQQVKRRSSGCRPSLTEDGVISSCTSSASAATVAHERLPTRCLSTVSNKPHKAHDAAWEAIRAAVAASPDGSISLSHFKFVQRLGSGDIGSVYLAELRDSDSGLDGEGTGCFFAVKVMDKASLSKRNKLQRARTEREILEMLDHPFLPTLYAHIDDGQHSCLVMEFCPGGDLHVLRQLQPGKRFSDDAVRFYAAEILTALEYLHMMGVIYRDLKPENVLVREDGHIMLSDFDLSLKCSVNPTLSRVQGESSSASWASPPTAPGGAGGGICNGGAGACMSPMGCVSPCTIHPIASCLPIPRVVPFSGRKVRRRRWTGASKRGLAGRFAGGAMPELLAEPTAARSMSFVGTHEYLAPEIILGEGHGSAVDWWTFGIFLYELLYSKTPFKGPDNEATLTNVVTQLLRFPTAAPPADEPLTLAAQLHQPHPSPKPQTPSVAAQDLIRGLLVKDPRKRLGAVKGATEIKQHAFFDGVNWALIRCATPPEIPSPFTMAGLRCSDGGGGVDAEGHVCWVSDGDNSDNGGGGGGGATPDFEFF